MKEPEQKAKLYNVSHDRRAVYARPQLVEFGAVGTLTQSGTLPGSEQGMMNECPAPAGMNTMNMC